MVIARATMAFVPMMIFLTGCNPNIPVNDDPYERDFAVCLSQDYLARNGFLEHTSEIDVSDIDMLGYDRMNHSENGVVDWDGLLQSREGFFSNRLFGVSIEPDNDGWYLIFYRFPTSNICAFANPITREVSVPITANCRVVGQVRNVSEAEILCR